MIKIYVSIILYFLFINSAYSQLNLMQSDSQIKWMQIQTDNFKIVYPDFLEEKANYTLNLLEHYKPLVSESYKIEPKKLTLIIRPEISSPNGFVTLAPRRSEWFNNASITPLVGSLEWFQSLAIHEYRHVVQYDYLSQGRTKWGYYLFGEGFLGFLLNIVMPTWYFEGDAVWAETTLSDGGRGRSPRFSARFKALLTSNQFPTYDDLLAGDYNTNLPNYYVYGYYLVTRAFNIYGNDVWKEIGAYASDHPWNPYAFYNGFHYVTGIRFKQFYNESLKELKQRWMPIPKDFQLSSTEQYQDFYSPKLDDQKKYYLNKTIDSHWGLFSENQLIKEFNITPKLSKIDIRSGKFLFTQEIPHHRYIYKGYSDLFIFDIKSKKQTRITHNKRYFHPQFNDDSSKLVATSFGENDSYSLHVLDNNGKLITKIIPPKGTIFSEATWSSKSTLGIIKIEQDGRKKLIEFNLDSGILTPLTPATRNNIYNLTFKGESFYFEADYQGKVNIFQFSLKTKRTAQCTDEFIGAYSPYINDKIHYVFESHNGKRLKSAPLNCIEESSDKLFTIKDYLGKGPSDNFFKKEPINIKDFNLLQKQSKSGQSHSELSGSISPHSWSFISGRGFQLSGTTTNNLGSLSLNGYTGISFEESTPFSGANISFMKYYPIFSLQIDHAEREKEVIKGTTSNWNELRSNIKMTLPYIYQRNLFSGFHLFSLSTGMISVSNNAYISEQRLSDDDLLTTSINFNSLYSKQMTKREIQPSWAYALNLNYTNLNTKNNDKNNYIGQINSNIKTPGFKKNHGFNFDFTREYRPKNRDLYELQSHYIPLFSYTFSRGHSYEYTPEYNKFVSEYVFPINYLKSGYKDWVYITRMYGKIFFDYTTLLNESDDDRTINSEGFELYFDTNTFRKFPLTYGIRLYHTQRDNSDGIEIFLATILN